MTGADKTLEAQLLDAGHPEEFVDYAMTHRDFYRGDPHQYVSHIERLIEDNAVNEARADADPSASLDNGSKRVEHDYTGDSLTHGGYDHTDQSRRW